MGWIESQIKYVKKLRSKGQGAGMTTVAFFNKSQEFGCDHSGR
jgi:hypothetical protein